jgi:hypothetical protein
LDSTAFPGSVKGFGSPIFEEFFSSRLPSIFWISGGETNLWFIHISFLLIFPFGRDHPVHLSGLYSTALPGRVKGFPKTDRIEF